MAGKLKRSPRQLRRSGLLEQSEFLETNIDLEPGDAFLLYTDGLYGSGREENPRLSSGRLGEMLQPIPASAQALLNRVVEQTAMNNGGKSAAGRRGGGGRPALKLTDKIFSIR